MKRDSGTYALVFGCQEPVTAKVGRLGGVELQPGFYIYVGSAHGPGGVKARVERHWRSDKRLHWHIDYVTEYLTPVEAWYVNGTSRDEHRWAANLAAQPGISAVQAFGASDCSCGSHFFRSSDSPDRMSFARHLGKRVQVAIPAATR